MRLRRVLAGTVVGGLTVVASVVWSTPVSALGKLDPSERRCFEINGPVGGVALVNLTPVEAEGAGDGQLASSNVTSPPLASNVNFGRGTVDPNVALAPIGAGEQVCFVNSVHTSVHLVGDHLGTIAAAAYRPAISSGATERRLDTRNSSSIPPNGRRCFSVAGSPGDAAVVNLTPVEATGLGDGLLVSSDVAKPPVASNVNFGPGTVDPNVAIAPIGTDGRVCFHNSQHSTVDLVADHLGTIDAASYTGATSSGAPSRRVDSRDSGGKVGPNQRRCFPVAGIPGDAALVNITPVEAGGFGDGQLVSADVASPPVASNVNFGPGTVDPNVALAPIGADGQVCYVNSTHTSVHLVADHLGTIAASAFTPTPTGAPQRRIDTRNEDNNGSHLLNELTIAAAKNEGSYDRDDWDHWIDADGDCQNTRAEVLIRDSSTSVTFTKSPNCIVATGTWFGPWTQQVFLQASDVDIDHMVPLANAHRSGGWAWSATKKRDFANDLVNAEALRAMDDGSNSSKSDRGPESWKPPVQATWCDYAVDWSTIKIRWSLTVTGAEHDALALMLDTCDGVITPPPDPDPEPDPDPDPDPGNCDPSYPTVCIPPPPPDLNCGDIPFRDFVVLQPDPHRFDGNKDGIGCQS